MSNHNISSSNSKLRPFIPFIILLMFSYTKDDIETFMMLYLFAQTSYQCDFNKAFGTYLYINAAVQIIVQPMWARLTDRYSHKSTVLLWSALLGESLIEVFMFIAPSNFGVILTLSLLRSVIHTENTLAMWKVFKQKLEFAHFHDSGTHDKIINTIGMWGITGEVVMDIIIFGCGYILCIMDYSFRTIAIYVYFMTTFPSFLVWLIAYLYFIPEYIEDDTIGDPSLRLNHQNNNSSIEESIVNINTLTNIGKKSPFNILKYSRLFHFHSVDVKQIENSKISSYQGIKGIFRYFKQGLLHIWNNDVCFGSLLHATFVCLFWKLMSGAESLNLAASNLVQEIPILDNLCGGQFTNLFYQFTWNNGFYIIGATFYIIVLVRTPPFFFFRYFWPIIGILFAICITPLFYDVPYALQVILAGMVGVFPWYIYRYDTYLCNASIDSEYIGILQGLIGYIRYITPALSGIFLAFNLVNLIFIVSYTVLFISIIYSIYIAFEYKEQLEEVYISKNTQKTINNST